PTISLSPQEQQPLEEDPQRDHRRLHWYPRRAAKAENKAPRQRASWYLIWRRETTADQEDIWSLRKQRVRLSPQGPFLSPCFIHLNNLLFVIYFYSGVF